MQVCSERSFPGWSTQQKKKGPETKELLPVSHDCPGWCLSLFFPLWGGRQKIWRFSRTKYQYSLDLRSSQAYVQQHQNLLLMLWCELQLWGRVCCTTNGQAEDVVYRLLVCDPWALLPCGHGGHHSQQTKYWSGRGVALTPRNTA